MSRSVLGPYRALGLDFEVEVDGEARAATERILGTVPGSPPGTAAQVTFTIVHEDDRWVLREGEKTITASRSGVEVCLRWLVTRITRRSLDHTPERLHIHAGTVVHEGRGIMVYGPSHAGKSTLVGALVQAGCAFLSDESAAIDPVTTRVHGWPKPLSLRSGALELLDLPLPSDSIRVPLQYPATELGTGGVVAETGIDLVLEVAYAAEAATELTEIHPADAVVHLGSNSLDLPRFGRGGVALLGRMAAGARCGRLSHSLPPGEAARFVLGLLHGDALEPHPVEALDRSRPPSGGPDPGPVSEASQVQPSRHVDAALIGRRVVVHDLRSGKIAALDEVGSQVWLNLDGESTVAEIAARYEHEHALAGVLAFVQELIDAELVVSATR